MKNIIFLFVLSLLFACGKTKKDNSLELKFQKVTEIQKKYGLNENLNRSFNKLSEDDLATLENLDLSSYEEDLMLDKLKTQSDFQNSRLQKSEIYKQLLASNNKEDKIKVIRDNCKVFIGNCDQINENQFEILIDQILDTSSLTYFRDYIYQTNTLTIDQFEEWLSNYEFK